AIDSTRSAEETAVHIHKSNKSAKVAAVAVAPPPAGGGGWRRGMGILDFILRLCALTAALAATTTMATTDQTLPFFTQFFQFQASYDDIPAFSFFVVANATASGYLVLSLPFSMVGILGPQAAGVKLLLLIFNTLALGLTEASAAAAASIVYLARNGNNNTNWVAICQQFNDFCQRVSGAVVASFIAALLFILLVIFSAVALRRR
ncbi:hypothetical protein NMG60_11033414, partial [Bertholletia excelsa]